MQPLSARFHRFFFFNDTATTEIYTLSLHDALPISARIAALRRRLVRRLRHVRRSDQRFAHCVGERVTDGAHARSEEHTSELQSRLHLVCRLLLEKKKKLKALTLYRPSSYTVPVHSA